MMISSLRQCGKPGNCGTVWSCEVQGLGCVHQNLDVMIHSDV